MKRALAVHPSYVARIVNRTLLAAMRGEEWAVRLTFERVDGKMPQAIVGDDDEPAVKFSRVLRTIVDPANQSGADANAKSSDG